MPERNGNFINYLIFKANLSGGFEGPACVNLINKCGNLRLRKFGCDIYL